MEDLSPVFISIEMEWNDQTSVEVGQKKKGD